MDHRVSGFASGGLHCLYGSDDLRARGADLHSVIRSIMLAGAEALILRIALEAPQALVVMASLEHLAQLLATMMH